MAALTAIGLGLGAASMGYGLYNQMEGREQAQQGYALQQQGSMIQAQAAAMQAQISKDQAATSLIYAGNERNINIAASNASLATAQQSRDINNQIVGFERQIEGQRQQAMEIDARRRGLEVIRNQQRARAVALTNATAQGASRGSGLQGGYGQISGQSNVNAMGIQQNLLIGQNIFGLNNQITDQRLAYSDLQYNYAVQQAALQTEKSNLAYAYAGANAEFQTRQADAGTLMSQGQGLVNQGSGYVSMGQSQQQFGAQMFNAGPQLFSMGMNASNVFPSLGGYFGSMNANPTFSWSNYSNPYYGPGF